MLDVGQTCPGRRSANIQNPTSNILFLSPARLNHAGNLAFQRELPEAQPAERELAQVAPRTPAAPAAVAVAALILRRLQIFGDFCCGCHEIDSLSSCRNGIPMPFNSASPSGSVRAVVVMVTFMPLVLSTLA